MKYCNGCTVNTPSVACECNKDILLHSQATEGVESVVNELAELMKSDSTTIPVPTAKEVSDMITTTSSTISALLTSLQTCKMIPTPANHSRTLLTML